MTDSTRLRNRRVKILGYRRLPIPVRRINSTLWKAGQIDCSVAVGLDQWCIVEHALIAETRQIEGPIFAVSNQLAESASHCRRLHESMTREARGNQEIRDAGQVSEDDVLVQCIEIVVARERTVQALAR